MLAAGTMDSAAAKKTSGGAAWACSSQRVTGMKARSQLMEGFRVASAGACKGGQLWHLRVMIARRNGKAPPRDKLIVGRRRE